MEAGDLRPPRPASPPAELNRTFRGGLGGPPRAALTSAGDLAAFMWHALLEVRGVWRYTGEILRQAGIICLGSALVIWVMMYLTGTLCGLEGNYVMRGFGATAYSGAFSTWCGLRNLAPYMFGYIVAAKIGCGLVAEIGSMRISDEIAATESFGINPMRYIVSTRLVAAWLTFPALFIVGLGFELLASFVVVVFQIGEVSRGGFELIFWLYQNPLDVLYVTIEAFVMGTLIVLVAMYHGYTASGGPVGVGAATARSMVLNLIIVHVVGSVATLAFWDPLEPNAPIGG